MSTLPRSLREALDQAVACAEPARCVEQVAATLARTVRAGDLDLPEACAETCESGYARRLLHRDPERGYSVVAMTWAPGQATPLHDHCGLWCVEVVADGRIEVQPFELVERDGERLRFEPLPAKLGEQGSAGGLIPPSEYHLIRNPSERETAITVHVYGGDLDRCRVYQPLSDAAGWYRPEEQELELAD